MSRPKDPNSLAISYHFRVSRRDSRSMEASARSRGMRIGEWIRFKVLNFESNPIPNIKEPQNTA
jgi:hypothetical protein